MNNKQYIVLAAFIAASTAYTFGQNMIDAVRFGSTDISGTARYRSMAGAFGALGGDISCMSDNPAGLAIFRGTNLISITPHVGFSNTETLGSVKGKDKDNNFSVSNFGAVFSFMPDNDGALVNFNLGFSIERKLQTFRKMEMRLNKPGYGDMVDRGQDPGSFGSYLFEQANSYLDDYDKIAEYLGTPEAWNDYNVPILSLLGFESYAIDVAPDDPFYVDNPVYKDLYQMSYMRERTRHDNYNISGALNFGDVLYAGVTVRITDFNSTIEHEFSEDSAPYDPHASTHGDYIVYENRTETKGSGIGLNLGMLWKPTEAWRVGAAIHTPTYLNMKEFHNAYMEADNYMYQEACEEAYLLGEEIPNNFSEWSDRSEFDYSTPWEYQFSTAYVFGSRAIASFEYDLRDFTSMRFHRSANGSYSDKTYFDDMNQTMKPHLKAQHTLKAGVEYRILPQLSARAGYAYKSSPYEKSGLYTDVKSWDISFLYRTATKPNYSTLGDQHYITAGAGWRGKNWNIDLSFMAHMTSEYYSPYPCDFSNSDIIDFNTNQYNWDLTFGYRF